MLRHLLLRHAAIVGQLQGFAEVVACRVLGTSGGGGELDDRELAAVPEYRIESRAKRY